MRALVVTMFAVACATLAACGSGTSTTISYIGLTPPPVPTGGNATPAAITTATMSPNGSAGGLTISPTTSSGINGITVAFGATSATGLITIAAWNSLPPGTTALTAAVGPAPAPVAYITLTAQTNATFNVTPSVIVNFANAPAAQGNSYYVASVSPGSQWTQPLLGPASFNTPSQLSLPANLNVPSFSLQANVATTLAIYSIPTPTFTDDWTSYAHDRQLTGLQSYNGANPLGKITPQNVSQLQLAWSVAPNANCDLLAANAQVVADEASVLVANGLVYYADTCGLIAALNRETGVTVWKYQAPVLNQVDGVLGTPVIDNGMLIVPIWGDPGNCTPATLATCRRANSGYLVALDAMTGNLRWATPNLTLGNMRGEPFVLNGLVYEGIGGGDDTSGYVNGGLAVFNEATGTQVGSMIQIAPPSSAFDGGSSWSPISYDGTNIYIGTGNTRANDGLQDSVLQLTPQNAAAPIVSNGYKISTYDGLDNDEDVGGGIMIYGGNVYFTAKNGNYYSYSTLNSATPLITTQNNLNSVPGGKGGIGTPTTDGTIITASSGYNSCQSPAVCSQSDLDCFHVGSGAIFGKLSATNSAIYSYAAYASGVGFIGIDNGATDGVPVGGAPVRPEFVAFDDTCHIIWKANASTVRGFFYGGPAVVQSGVYAVDNAGNVYAWKLPYQMGIQARVKLQARMRQTRFDLLRNTHYVKRHRPG